MGGQSNSPAREASELPPVFVEVPDRSGLPDAGTSTALNTGLTVAEVLTATEPAPVMYATKAQRRRRDILGVTWILVAIISGVLYGVYRDAAYPGEADWALMVLAVTVPFVVVFSLYPHWQGRRLKKRHKAWLSRFILLWPLRERLVEVERIRDLRQRVIVEAMAATMAEGREALLRQSGAASQADSALLMQALTAVGAYAKATSDEPALEADARQAVDHFSEKAGRRRELPEPSGPPAALPGKADQRLRRRSEGSVNDGGR
ncbi:hypothetical protein ACFVYC_12090 [Pseudarthrobacter sp. NPDC058329]|uniref:hypothetical protein n=1 Tax=Pseudarthrobacter sp. NPDC058329 TaxID=3346448 RepID=UPI0036DA29CB